MLITGAIPPFVAPLSPLFDEVVAAELVVEDGRYTGFLERAPLVGEARAAWMRHYAGDLGADLQASYAYADSHSDLPMLEVVGNPIVVNPDVALFRTAKSRKWVIEDWHTAHRAPAEAGAAR